MEDLSEQVFTPGSFARVKKQLVNAAPSTGLCKRAPIDSLTTRHDQRHRSTTNESSTSPAEEIPPTDTSAVTDAPSATSAREKLAGLVTICRLERTGRLHLRNILSNPASSYAASVLGSALELSPRPKNTGLVVPDRRGRIQIPYGHRLRLELDAGCSIAVFLRGDVIRLVKLGCGSDG